MDLGDLSNNDEFKRKTLEFLNKFFEGNSDFNDKINEQEKYIDRHINLYVENYNKIKNQVTDYNVPSPNTLSKFNSLSDSVRSILKGSVERNITQQSIKQQISSGDKVLLVYSDLLEADSYRILSSDNIPGDPKKYLDDLNNNGLYVIDYCELDKEKVKKYTLHDITEKLIEGILDIGKSKDISMPEELKHILENSIRVNIKKVFDTMSPQMYKIKDITTEKEYFVNKNVILTYNDINKTAVNELFESREVIYELSKKYSEELNDITYDVILHKNSLDDLFNINFDFIPRFKRINEKLISNIKNYTNGQIDIKF